MKSEGRGIVAPHRQMTMLSVPDGKQIVATALDRDKHRQYGRGGSQWKRGFVKSVVVPGVGEVLGSVVPIVIGLHGEYATKIRLECAIGRSVRLDVENRTGGDGGVDVSVFGHAIQIKTRNQESGPNLIRCRTQYGRDVMSPAHSFVFCEWLPGSADVAVLGTATREAVLSWPQETSRYGHVNYVGEDDDLSPFSDLTQRLRNCRELLSC